jgi:wyosine [tRNA(Phe)-imidazoG37] synthetase (radical SAM superfamily)
MENYKYVFGPIPSRRMGLSVGISPIPKKYCNYSCTYCQIGRTHNLTNKREEYFKLEDIINEFKQYLNEYKDFDVVTVCGEGEPTLYLRLGDLITELKKLTDKPVAVITNSALMYDEQVREDLKKADIVLPSLDAYKDDMFKKINRAYGTIKLNDILEGLKIFSKEYTGQLWIEIMIMKDFNDSTEDFKEFRALLDTLTYDRVYINSPVRPPAEGYVKQPSKEALAKAVEILGGSSIDEFSSQSFHSEIKDDYEAILSIIKRHPMNQFEIRAFIEGRNNASIEDILDRLSKDASVEVVAYKNYISYRLK